MKIFSLLFLCFSTMLWAGEEIPFQLPADTTQVILAIADDWDSSTATLQTFERSRDAWKEGSLNQTVRLGKNGLAWGVGLHPANLPGSKKREGDGKTPAGVFWLGGAYGYESEIPIKKGTSYHQVGERDLWVEDPQSPLYNQHITLNHPADSWWEKKQQMRLNDPAHKLKLFIMHNYANQCEPGSGSSIFFHIWRSNGAKPSTGCIVMPENQLRSLIAWIDVSEKPVFIMLPREVYEKYREMWKLP